MNTDHNAQLRMIGLAIAHYRKEAGLSQEQLAYSVGVSRTHISNIEARNMNAGLSLDLLFSIADVLEIPVWKLFAFPSREEN